MSCDVRSCDVPCNGHVVCSKWFCDKSVLQSTTPVLPGRPYPGGFDNAKNHAPPPSQGKRLILPLFDSSSPPTTAQKSILMRISAPNTAKAAKNFRWHYRAFVISQIGYAYKNSPEKQVGPCTDMREPFQTLTVLQARVASNPLAPRQSGPYPDLPIDPCFVRP